jgi:hypothetical protein
MAAAFGDGICMKTYPKRAIKADSGESTMLNRDSMGVTVALPEGI